MFVHRVDCLPEAFVTYNIYNHYISKHAQKCIRKHVNQGGYSKDLGRPPKALPPCLLDTFLWLNVIMLHLSELDVSQT